MFAHDVSLDPARAFDHHPVVGKNDVSLDGAADDDVASAADAASDGEGGATAAADVATGSGFGCGAATASRPTFRAVSAEGLPESVMGCFSIW